MSLDPFLIRLIIGVLVIFLFQYIFGVLTIDPKAKQILEVILIIVVVVWILLGYVLIH